MNGDVHLIIFIRQCWAIIVVRGEAAIRGYCDKLHTAESQPWSHGSQQGRARPGTHKEQLFLEVQRHFESAGRWARSKSMVGGCWKDDVGEERRRATSSILRTRQVVQSGGA